MPLLIGVPVVYTRVHENSYAREVMDTEKVDPHLTATIVGSYVRHHTVGADQVSDLIATVHRALGQLGQPNQPEEVRTPAVSVRRSVSQDYVVCMDCGYRGKTLRRHISTRHVAQQGRIPEALGTAYRSPPHGSSLFRAPFDFGKGAWPGSQVNGRDGLGSVADSSTGPGRCRW